MFINPYDPSKWYKPTEDQRYHTVYLTTNLVNNKIYVGKQTTYNPYDTYLGSGLRLKSAIQKYGNPKFSKIILYFCIDMKHSAEIEKNIVDEWFVSRDDTYNIAIGGEGGYTSRSITTRKKNIKIKSNEHNTKQNNRRKTTS